MSKLNPFNDSSVPEWKSQFELGWLYGGWSANWTIRHIDELEEDCSDFLDGSPDSLANQGVCSDPDLVNNENSRNELDSTTYHDIQVAYSHDFGPLGWTWTLGVNNAFDEDPPECYSCSLNGYDPSTYDVPGRFYYVRLRAQ